MRARISRALLARLLAEAAASPEREICGLLLGAAEASQAYVQAWLITDASAAPNISATPADSFEIDPAALFAAHRTERAGGPPVIGHYHSHPHGAPHPSACDAAAATEPGRLWLILGEGRAMLWRAVPGGSHEGAFEPVSLETFV